MTEGKETRWPTDELFWRNWQSDLVECLKDGGVHPPLVEQVANLVGGLIDDLSFARSIQRGLSLRIGTLVDTISTMDACNCVECERNQ